MITFSRRMSLWAIILFLSFTFSQCTDDGDSGDTTETVTDIDGNVYTTVRIGDQVWMAENLKTTTFNDGTSITEWDNSGTSWSSLNENIPHYQWQDTSDPHDVYDDSVVLPFDFYGAIYNHFAIESGKLAPEGWRIPTRADYEELVAFIASNGDAGNEAVALKSTTGWDANSGNGTNSYGFNCLANGYANTFGGPTAPGLIANLGTSNYNSTSQTRIALGLFNESTVTYPENSIHLGVAIRCIKE